MPQSNVTSPTGLGSNKISKLLVQYSVPAIIASVATSLYNIIDSIFIGRGVGAMAIAGLAITFPLMNLVIAFCTLIAVGGATISSIFLGQKNIDRATDVVNNVVVLCLIHSVIFGGLTLIFLDEILNFFGATPETIPYAREFMKVILYGTPISYIFIGLNNIMRATGYPAKAMVSALLSVGVNIILAPIFIFKFGWGIKGAAIATVSGQTVACAWVLWHFLSKKSYIHLQRERRWLTPDIIRRIYAIGLSPFLMNICACVVVVFINKALLDYGAGQWDRVKSTLRIGIWLGVAITSVGWIATECFPDAISSLFTVDPTLIEIANRGSRIYFFFYPLVGCQIVIQNFFQSVGKPKVSIFLSLTRQLLFLIPFLIILPRYWGIDGVWASMAASDFIAFIFAIVTLIIVSRRQTREFDKSRLQTQ